MKGFKILIVEDDQMIGDLMQKYYNVKVTTLYGKLMDEKL